MFRRTWNARIRRVSDDDRELLENLNVLSLNE